MKKRSRGLKTIAGELQVELKRETSNVLAIGTLLLEAKELVDHGDWLAWLTVNFGGSTMSAERYMNAARFVTKNNTLLNLKLRRTAWYWLGANMDDCPQTIIDSILETAKTEWVNEEFCSEKLYWYRREESDRRWEESGPAMEAALEARARDREAALRREQAEIDDILDGPPPDLPPPLATVTELLLSPFDQAVGTLAQLYTKPVSRFGGTTHTPERLQAIGEFLLAVGPVRRAATPRGAMVKRKEDEMSEAPMSISLPAYIRALIDHATEFDLDLDQIVASFPNMAEADFELALTTVAAELRVDGLRILRQADAFDGMKHEWVERLRSRS